MLIKYGMENCKEYDSPLQPGTILYPNEDRIDFPYKEWLGSLMHLRHTRPDIFYAINQLSRVAHAPGKEAVEAIKRVFGYLKRTIDIQLIFRHCKMEDMKLSALTDADWASNKVDRKSVGGHIVYLGPSMISASSRVQQVVSTSTQAAEVVEIFRVSKKIDWIKRLYEELPFVSNNDNAVVITDSSAAVKAIAKLTEGNKHLGVYLCYLRQLVKDKIISCHHVSREYNTADIMTKQDTIKRFKYLKEEMFEEFRIEYVDYDPLRPPTDL